VTGTTVSPKARETAVWTQCLICASCETPPPHATADTLPGCLPVGINPFTDKGCILLSSSLCRTSSAEIIAINVDCLK